MKITKKVLCVLVVLSMLVGIFSVMASATMESGTAVDLYISVDKEYYKAGDEVVITFSAQAIPAVGQLTIGGQYAIGYDSSVINPIDTTDNSVTAQRVTALAAGYDEAASICSFSWNNIGNNGDWIEEDDIAAYNWDEVIMYCIGTLNDSVGGNDKPVDLLQVTMKLNDDVPDGDYVIGFNEGSYRNYSAYILADEGNNYVYGHDDDYGYGTTANYSYGTCTIQVGEPSAAGSVVTEKGPQIRYTKTEDGSFANAYDVRTRATIAAADVEATFGTADEAALETAITSVGFVYAPAGTAFDTAAAQAAAKAGTSEGGYTVAPVNYIQKDADGNLMFTCLVTGINTNQTGTGLQTYAYICVNGVYYFYDAVTTVSYNELFTNNWASAASAYGWDTSVPSLG